MTGYGRAQDVLHGREIVLEIKSVNHRYFEYNSRIPRSYSYLDDAMKKAVSAGISRGKIEVSVFVQNITAQDTTVTVNMDVAKGYYTALNNMAETLDIQNDVKISTLSRFHDIFALVKAEDSEKEIEEDVMQLLQKAMAAFTQMRSAEGEKLKDDILQRLTTIENLIVDVEKDAAERIVKYREKLHQKMLTILDDSKIDEARILQEAAIYADKVAVDEETVRLKSHIKQYREILNTDSSIGKKLDFLTQELNREVNTIGSKANDLNITRTVVDMKSEIEKIREQIQNIE